jgi:hypothetical protein
MKPGRNDPCWCGSGKKYKKCHLDSDEEEARTSQRSQAPLPGEGDPLHRHLLEELAQRIKHWHTAEDVVEATHLYFGKDASEVDENDQDTDSFIQWYLLDFRHPVTGRTAVEEFLRDPSLSQREREMLESWRDARFGIFEAERVDEGRGLALRDLVSGDRFFVHDVSSSRSLVRWDCLVTRVEFFEGKWLFPGNGVLVPRQLVPELLNRIVAEAKQRGLRVAEFLRTNSHRLHRMIHELHQETIAGMQMVNYEGDPIEFSAATYRVLDKAALLSALQNAPEFEDHTSETDTPDIHSFAWLEIGDQESRRSYGQINISDGQLRLECNSRRRLKRGRKLLEEHAGRAIEHSKDSFESLKAAKRRVATAPKEKAAEIPFEIESELLQKVKDEHYAKWPDEPLPALGGKTPRSAVRRADGRSRVIDLIRTMENSEERARKEGRPAYSFSRLREDLGLEEE